ncbi:MAG: hypothetical protein GWN18_16570, partial [Thermoplasmata archaeon]|nr:hypothetical protein [Thermoplasmata archaeon]NIS13692.1 hypothetical protein [Thermoplasmata archaeon]NIS21563.1 hypothetical protein [Thermoplasmata archaeon]NIT79133.1 hypothetical protein [Thermoplasmata archaeon]NIU50602.1 hypothetical protein [Thermoplasmata archaeon]
MAKLVSLEIWPMPEEVELGTEHLLSVWVRDHEDKEVSGRSVVSIEVTEGCETSLRWSWNSVTGHLCINGTRPGGLVFDVVADMNGSTVRMTHHLTVNGTLDEPVLEPTTNRSEQWFMVGYAFFMITVMTIGTLARKARERA